MGDSKIYMTETSTQENTTQNQVVESKTEDAKIEAVQEQAAPAVVQACQAGVPQITHVVPEEPTPSENAKDVGAVPGIEQPKKDVKTGKGRKAKKTKVEKPKKEKKPANTPKTFELLDIKSGEVLSTFTNKQPRGAALKAAAEGHQDVILREVGSNTDKRIAVIHRFKGERKQAPWALPYNQYALKKVEELSGKPVPPELNVKDDKTGKSRKALLDAGFKDYLFWKPNVKKVERLDVPKVEGKSLTEIVKEFVMNMKAA